MVPKGKEKIEIEKTHADPLPSLNQAVTANYSDFLGTALIANHFFASQEVAALHGASQHEQQYRLFEYWTLRESYIKARGMGFSLPLERFSFHFAHDHTIDLVIEPELGDDSSRWQFWQFRPTSEHLVAVCAEKLNGQSSKLLVRETTPTISEKMLVPEFLRTSELGH